MTRLMVFDFVTHLGGAQRATLHLLEWVRDRLQVRFVDAYGTVPEHRQWLKRSGIDHTILLPDPRYPTIGCKDQPLRRAARTLAAMPELIAVRRRLQRCIQADRPDVLKVISTKALPIALSATRGLDIPILYWCHGGCIPTRIFDRGWHRRIAGFVCLSETVKKTSIDRLGPLDKVSVVPNALDVEALRARAAGPLDHPLPDADRPVRLLVVGTLLTTKGQACAIRALRRLVEADQDAALYLAGDTGSGDSGYLDTLKALAGEQGVSERVHFLGWRQDVPQLIRAVTAFVLPSHTEGMPLSVMEAMALRTPAVVTPVGSVPEMLDGGRAGWLFDIDDDAALAEALIEVHRQPDIRKTKLDAAEQILADRYRPALVTDRCCEVVNRLAGRPLENCP